MNGPITALIFSPFSFVGGGVYSFNQILSRHFSDDIRTEIFSMGQRKGPLGLLLRPLVPFYDALRLALLLLARRHDVYQVSPSFFPRSVLRDGLFLVVLRLFRRKQIVVFVHGWSPDYYGSIARRPFSRWLFRGVYGYASKVMVLASSFAEDLTELGIERERIHVLTTMFEGNLLKRATRRRDDDGVRLLFLARLVASKGVYELLEALRRLSSAHPNLTLTIAGDGPDARGARDWCARHGLEHKVSFPGHVGGTEKAQLLVDSDIFVLPSAAGEGCPVALLEAMGAGMPVIVTPVGGIPAIVRDGVNGFLISSRDPSNVVAAIERLLRDPVARARMGHRNREEAWQKYEASRVAAVIESHYVELARPRDYRRADFA